MQSHALVMANLLLIVVVLLGFEGGANGLSGHGVCTYAARERYHTKCGWPCWNGPNTHYRLITKNKCCTGWSQSGGGCDPICSTSCKNGGSCVAPDTCRCRPGYTESDCRRPICSPVCGNGGTCVSPNTCSCTDQYKGSVCQTPICRTHCFNRAPCVAPEKCKCDKHWTDDHCTTPVCDPPCGKGGSCIQPNECRYPTVSEPDKACHNKRLDVAFVVDTSGSIGVDNFQKMKNFIKSVIGHLEVSEQLTHVSMMKFGLEPQVQFGLTDGLNKTVILEAVDNTTYLGGATSTSDAIEMMRTQGFAGERPVAPDVGIVITDGLSKFPRLTRAQADLAKQEGVVMFAVGIGQDASHTELFGIASGLARVFEVADFKKLGAIDEDVARSICEVELPKGYQPRTTTPPTTTPDGCFDTDNCTDYARDMCFDYEDWASVHCAKTCGFCGSQSTAGNTEACNDTIDNCDQYGKYMCTDGKFFTWANKHCAEYCRFCGNKTDTIDGGEVANTTASITVPAPAPVCQDNIDNCAEYGGTGTCTDRAFAGWVRTNCPKYCGLCYNLRHHDSREVGSQSCPVWDLPEECTLEYKEGSCCPFPVCPPDFRLAVKRG